MSLRRRGRRGRARRACHGRRTRSDDLWDSDGQQYESDESPEPEWRAAKMAGEDEVEKLPRHKAAADDRQAKALRHGALPLDFERMRDRRSVEVRLWKPTCQGLRNRSKISPAHSAEPLSLSLIRSAFWTEHRVCSEKSK